MNTFLFWSCLILALEVTAYKNPDLPGAKSYNDFKVYRSYPKNNDEVDFIQSFESQENYDFWTDLKKGEPVEIMVSPENERIFENKLSTRGIKHEVIISDVQQLINLEKVGSRLLIPNSGGGHNMTWTDYHPLENIYSYLDYLQTKYDFVTTQSIGKSYEGRDMRIVRICRGGCGAKPAVWIDGGIHAREWIAPATATWIIKELVENDYKHPDLTENLDWYILPCFNPDGYAFSRTTDRFWRKTRSDNGNNKTGCKGVDANRNWDFHWNDGGSSSNMCSQNYRGPKPFSEVETRNVRDFLLSVQGKLIFFNTLHSAGEMILLPWSYTKDPAPNYSELYNIAVMGRDAMQTEWKIGCVPCLMYPASGTSMDWAYGVANIPYAFAMELRRKGFVLPPDEIIPAATETWNFHITVVRHIYSKVTQYSLIL